VQDPVNIATRVMHDSGISWSSRQEIGGDQPNSLNPYSVADWVIGVGSGRRMEAIGILVARRAGYGTFYPTLVAPGENVVSTRATGINVVGTAGLQAHWFPLRATQQTLRLRTCRVTQ